MEEVRLCVRLVNAVLKLYELGACTVDQLRERTGMALIDVVDVVDIMVDTGIAKCTRGVCELTDRGRRFAKSLAELKDAFGDDTAFSYFVELLVADKLKGKGG